MISIIFPIYNEEKILSEKTVQFRNLSANAELIFVDGGSSDNSAVIAAAYGKVIRSKAGRAAQMNSGARSAAREVLLFLHADTGIAPDTLLAIEEAINSKDFVGGCLTQRIDSDSFIYRLIERQGNIRARRHKIFYGDQGIFVKKDVFERIGGFPEVPIMEDVLFTRKLRKIGQTVVMPDKIMVSARRWERKGIIKTTILFNLMIILFRLKVPLRKIKRLYENIR